MRGVRIPNRLCEWCGEDYHPRRQTQRVCGLSCRAHLRWSTTTLAQRKAHADAMRAHQARRRVAGIRSLLAGAKSLGDAYRLGYDRGYKHGWQTGRRRAA